MDPNASPRVAQAYEAVRTGCLAIPRPRSGQLVATGATRLDLIHRLSTNDLNGISDGELRSTVLTTAIGRIVDRLQVISFGDRLTLLTSPGREKLVQDWLLRHIFFQDDVRLSPGQPTAWEWFLAGPLAAESLRQSLSLREMPASGQAVEFPGGLLWRTCPPEPSGFRILANVSDPAHLAELLGDVEDKEAGELYELLRIESGYPEYGSEFDEGDIPLEVGLTYAVSFTKGCYLGQEIIARMESRARIPRRLMGVMVTGPVSAPVDLVGPSGTVGRVTSTAWHPRLGWIGLAVVRSGVARAVQLTAGESCTVRLTDLPFFQPA